MNWPDFYVITGRPSGEQDWWRRFRNVLQSGYSLIQIRAPGDDDVRLEARAARARELCTAHASGARLLLNGPVGLVRKLDLPGVHLRSDVLMGLAERPLSERRLVGASCHSAGELDHAAAIGVDFVCLSPISATPSHAGARTLGFERLAELAAQYPIPIYALGGMQPGNLEQARRSGAVGVAGISAFWV